MRLCYLQLRTAQMVLQLQDVVAALWGFVVQGLVVLGSHIARSRRNPEFILVVLLALRKELTLTLWVVCAHGLVGWRHRRNFCSYRIHWFPVLIPCLELVVELTHKLVSTLFLIANYAFWLVKFDVRSDYLWMLSCVAHDASRLSSIDIGSVQWVMPWVPSSPWVWYCTFNILGCHMRMLVRIN